METKVTALIEVLEIRQNANAKYALCQIVDDPTAASDERLNAGAAAPKCDPFLVPFTSDPAIELLFGVGRRVRISITPVR